MNLLSLIPGGNVARLVGYGALVLACAGAGGAVAWWGLSPRIELAQHEAANQAKHLQEAQDRLRVQAEQLNAAQAQAERNNQVDRALANIRDSISQYSNAQLRALQELRQHDEEVANYLRGTVPARLGRLYERPETTDPAAYGSPALLRGDAVHTPGAAGAGQQ